MLKKDSLIAIKFAPVLMNFTKVKVKANESIIGWIRHREGLRQINIELAFLGLKC